MLTSLSKEKFVNMLIKENERFANILDPFTESILHDEDLLTAILNVVDQVCGSPSIKNLQLCADWFHSKPIPKYRVLLEQTDEITNMALINGKIVFNSSKADIGEVYYFMHIVSNEPAEVGQIGEIDGELFFISHYRKNIPHNKVVASTDDLAELPSPSEYFIRSYCKDPSLTIERLGIGSRLVEIDFKFSEKKEDEVRPGTMDIPKSNIPAVVIATLDNYAKNGIVTVNIGKHIYFKRGCHPHGSDWALEKEMVPVHKDWLRI